MLIVWTLAAICFFPKQFGLWQMLWLLGRGWLYKIMITMTYWVKWYSIVSHTLLDSDCSVPPWPRHAIHPGPAQPDCVALYTWSAFIDKYGGAHTMGWVSCIKQSDSSMRRTCSEIGWWWSFANHWKSHSKSVRCNDLVAKNQKIMTSLWRVYALFPPSRATKKTSLSLE